MNIIIQSYMTTLYHMSMSLHALLLLVSQLVLHPHLINFTTSFLIRALLKCSSIYVSFHKTTFQSLLLMIYGSFPLWVQPHQQPWWLLKTSGSWNSTAILLLINIPRLLLIPQIFEMISYLVLTSLTNVASLLIMKIIKCNGWNALFLFVTLRNFFIHLLHIYSLTT